MTTSHWNEFMSIVAHTADKNEVEIGRLLFKLASERSRFETHGAGHRVVAVYRLRKKVWECRVDMLYFRALEEGMDEKAAVVLAKTGHSMDDVRVCGPDVVIDKWVADGVLKLAGSPPPLTEAVLLRVLVDMGISRERG